jgi:hypothetical protein
MREFGHEVTEWEGRPHARSFEWGGGVKRCSSRGAMTATMATRGKKGGHDALW